MKCLSSFSTIVFIRVILMFDQDIVAALEEIGHEITTVTGFASVVSIGATPNGWNPMCDPRKHGQCDGFWFISGVSGLINSWMESWSFYCSAGSSGRLLLRHVLGYGINLDTITIYMYTFSYYSNFCSFFYSSNAHWLSRTFFRDIIETWRSSKFEFCCE